MAATELIPVLGAFLGAIPAVAIALFVPQGGFFEALLVAGLFLIAQQLEGNLLVPRIQGGSVGVHPLIVLFATLAGTALYGILGAIFAVPVVAIVAATIRYLARDPALRALGQAARQGRRGRPEKQETVTPSMPAGTASNASTDDDAEERNGDHSPP